MPSRLCLAVMVYICVGVGTVRNVEASVHFTNTVAEIHTAACFQQLASKVDAVDLILAVEGGKEKALGKVSSEECKSGCVVPGAGVATRGHYGNASTPTTLLVAWEPSWSLDNREDTLTCICLGGGHQYSRPASVKQIPAKKLRFFVNKTQNNIDSNSFLQIHMQVDHNRWVPIGRKLNESRRVTRSFVFYSRINGVVIAKILDTPQVAVVTILISNTSQLFEDPQWECRMVKRSGDYTFCQIQEPSKQSAGDSSHTIVAEPCYLYYIIIGVLAFVLFIIICVLCFCLHKYRKRPNKSGLENTMRLSLKNNYETALSIQQIGKDVPTHENHQERDSLVD